ncbi:MAG TPA: PAS domain S-box protein [Pyrinomonadaceae bacterium]|nr:PAS domain S-box protein [Pyrinomonadaceae bacterium]
MGRKSDDVTASPSELVAGGEAEGRRAESRAELDRVRREAQAQITNTLERITDGFISLDPEWRYTYINRAGSVMANRPPEDFIGKNIWDVYPDALGTAYETEYKRAMREQTPVEFEERLPSADVWLEVNAYPSADGLSVFFRDVTKRKQAEGRLRESEAQFRRMADNAPVMVWVTAANATCTYLSQSWYDFTGQTPETGLGFGWLDATHPDDQQAAHDTFVRANEKREAFRIEYRLRRKDGSYAWAIDSAKPRFREDGEFLGYVGSVIDITDRKQAEERLRESEERYRTLFNSIDEGFCIIELIFDDAGEPLDYRFVEVNPTFERQTGLKNAAGKTAREMVPNLESRWFEIYGRVASTGEPIRFVDGSEAMGRWFDVYAFRVGDATSRKVAIPF